jgi:spoIIIJ-associated protein
MSPRLEFEGKSVEKAVQKACEELDIPKEKLKHDVISYGSSGIFGLVGTKKARIRVILPEPTPVADPETPVIGKPNGSSQKQEMKVESASTHTTLNDFEINRFPDDPVDLGRSVLQNIIDRITTDAQISVDESSERILFNVEGGNAAVLIGKRGQTLEAIQYLVEKIVNKRIEARVRLQIDVEGYMETRRTNLQRLAERLAEKSKRTGKPVTIGQMNAQDRRVVHLTLKDDNGVRTQSMGDGYYRKLVIFPRKSFSQKKNANNITDL